MLTFFVKKNLLFFVKLQLQPSLFIVQSQISQDFDFLKVQFVGW